MAADSIKIPNPDTKLGVIKRYLHVLALLQNDDEGWTSELLSKFLQKDEAEADGGGITGKAVRDYIGKYLKGQLGVDIVTQRGSNRTRLAEDIDQDMLCRLLGVYSLFVVDDSQREQVLRVFADRNPRRALWILARIYFAVKTRKSISFTYTNTRNERKEYTINPYFTAFRNNGLYLVGKLIGKSDIRRFVLNRVENLKIIDDNILSLREFADVIPTAEEFFAGSLGAYGNTKEIVEMTIRYKKDVRLRIEDSLAHLGPDIAEKEEWVESTFRVSDVRTVCSQLLYLGSDAEIVAPPSARDQMRALLADALKVYTL